MEHELKTWVCFYNPVISGKKTFEVRQNDRGFKVGDTLLLKEFMPCLDCSGSGRVWDVGDKTECGCPKPHGEYTGRESRFNIEYLLDEFSGIKDGYVIMSISPKN